VEGIMRGINDDALNVEVVHAIRDDVEYYFDSYQSEEYQQIMYDEVTFRETTR
jgi:CCR4-NOT transcriptional regulation complex NOT5 subunit